MFFATSPRQTQPLENENDFFKKIKGFPYKFGNRKELLSRQETTSEEETIMMTRFLQMPGSADGKQTKDGFKLFDGFKMAYLALLEAIVTSNGQMIGKICEPQLHHEFNHGFQKLNFFVKEVQLLNKDDFTFDLRVLDWH